MSEEDMIKLPAHLLSFASKIGGAASIRFSASEISSDQYAELQRYLGSYGHLLFAEADIAEKDIPEDIPDDNQKKPSQRLRAVLFVFWKQQGSIGDFNVWYRSQMEKLIEHYKAKLQL
ncbi:MAG: hypothetical protein AB7S70_06080 [Hyphomicrobium sp.]|uniref:hypothetical protein n=1 Tax=Hyphomicrobium sp. TaxID=82 RepID=UPI003D09C1D0